MDPKKIPLKTVHIFAKQNYQIRFSTSFFLMYLRLLTNLTKEKYSSKYINLLTTPYFLTNTNNKVEYKITSGGMRV